MEKLTELEKELIKSLQDILKATEPRVFGGRVEGYTTSNLNESLWNALQLMKKLNN